jgi:hypothetical protein
MREAAARPEDDAIDPPSSVRLQRRETLFEFAQLGVEPGNDRLEDRVSPVVPLLQQLEGARVGGTDACNGLHRFIFMPPFGKAAAHVSKGFK